MKNKYIFKKFVKSVTFFYSLQVSLMFGLIEEN